jgi:hypothetical protein
MDNKKNNIVFRVIAIIFMVVGFLIILEFGTQEFEPKNETPIERIMNDSQDDLDNNGM